MGRNYGVLARISVWIDAIEAGKITQFSAGVTCYGSYPACFVAILSHRQLINLESAKPRSASNTTLTPAGINRATCRSTRWIVHNRTLLLDWATTLQAIGMVRPRYTTPTQTMQKQFHTTVVSRSNRDDLCPTVKGIERLRLDALLSRQSGGWTAIGETVVDATEHRMPMISQHNVWRCRTSRQMAWHWLR